jgi:hypothetical protein
MKYSTDLLTPQTQIFKNKADSQAARRLQIPQPDFTRIDRCSFPPQPTNFESFFLYKLYQIKQPKLRFAAQKSIENIYSSLNQLIEYITNQPHTLAQIYNSSFVLDISTALDEIEIYTTTSKRVLSLQKLCQQSFENIQSLLSHLNPELNELKAVDWSQPEHTHLQELMFVVEKQTQDFIDKLDHHSIQSFTDLLETPDLSAFSPTQAYYINNYVELYTQYDLVRRSLLILMQILKDIKLNQLIDKKGITVLRDDLDPFYTNLLYPLIAKVLTPSNLNSQIHALVQSKILNPKHN